MLTGTIIASDLSVRGNRILKSGDKVTENDLGEVKFMRLVNEGFIKCDEVVETTEPIKEIELEEIEEEKNSINDLLEKSSFGNKNKRKK